MLTLAAGALVGTALVAAGTTPAAAVDGSNGTPGFCIGDEGTTVVVDLTALGDDVIVRCAPGDEKRTGFETLEAAGFEFESTTGSGMTSVCRIEGRPAADEELDLDGKSGYREACTGMPPAEAYWSYWNAESGGKWGFSQKGPQESQAIIGGFEAWSFALNSTPKEPAVPSIDPVQPSGTSGDSGTQNGVEWSGGEESEADDSTAAEDSGSDFAPWVAVGVIALLVVLILLTAIRRRARSQSGDH